MRRTLIRVLTALTRIAVAAVGFGCFSAILFVLLYRVEPGACITEVLGETFNVAGIEFELSETNCDLLLSKDSAITLFASRPGGADKAALFKYVTFNFDERPSVEAIGSATLLISMRAVSSIYFQNDRWQGMTITYRIDRIEYPKKK